MKKAIKAITGIALVTLLFSGALVELTTPSLIVITIALAWVILVAFATLRRRHGTR